MSNKLRYSLLILIIVLHFYVVIGNSISFLLLPFYTPWYIATPLCSFIFYVSLVRRVQCPLTELENKIRMSIGLKELDKSFIVYYIIRPIMKITKKEN